MASITIRELPESAKEELREQAAEYGMPLETYVRQILQQVANSKASPRKGIVEIAESYFGEANGVELNLPSRHSKRESPSFAE